MDDLRNPGPFQVIRSVPGPGNGHEALPRRRYECSHYQCCLSLAAALNWDSFTCRGCNGTINQNLLWRARSESRKDNVVKKICEFPDAPLIEGLAATPTATVAVADAAEREAVTIPKG